MMRKFLISLLFPGLLIAASGVRELRYAPGEIIIKYEKYGQSAKGSEILAEQKLFIDNLKLNLNNLKIKSYSPVFNDIIREMIDKNQTEDEIIHNKVFNIKNKATLSLIKKTTFSNILLIKVDKSIEDMEELASNINNRSDLLTSQGIRIVYAEPNYLKTSSIGSNDPLYSQQWSHQTTKIEKAWDITQGDPKIKIAIIDTGVDPTHPDLKDNLIPGYDFVDIDVSNYSRYYKLPPGEDYTQTDNDCTDYNGHGTHCAGIAAAVGDNGIGVKGVAPKCKIMPVRAGFSLISGTQEYGVFETTSIVQAINYAVENGANVISMSFGGDRSNTEEAAIKYAAYRNVLLVAAAGNSGSADKSYPAAYDEVLAVTSINNGRYRSSFSTYGTWTDIAAPGESIISTVPLTGGAISDPSGYRILSGTSMAAPYIAGVAALLLSKNPTMSSNVVYQSLKTSVDLNYISDYYIGSGIINVFKVLSGNEACISKITAPHNINNIFITHGDLDISGRASGKFFSKYSFEYSDYLNANPVWQPVDGIYSTPVDSGYLGTVHINQTGVYYIRLKVTSTDNIAYTDVIGPVTIDKRLKVNWPVSTRYEIGSTPVLSDIDGDGSVETIFTSSNGGIYVADQYGNNKPGWPVMLANAANAQGGVGYCSPAVGDINNDGKQEIVVRDGEFVYVFDYRGSQLEGWPRDLGRMFAGNAMTGSATIADINNDGYKDIIVTFLEGKIFAFNYNGQQLWGWPFTIPVTDVFTALFSTPVVSDLNDDGNIDIIIQCFNEAASKGYLYAINNLGNVLPGWPKEIGNGSRFSPIVADINNDGKNEIIAATYQNSGLICVYAFTKEGNLLNGFPVQLNDGDYGYYNLTAGISAGDINNDGYKEIIVASSGYNYILWAIDRNGKVLWNTPNQSFEYNENSIPVIADINGDGKPEIIVSKYNNGNLSGKIVVVDNNGNKVPALSCIIPEQIRATPSIGNIDGDNKLELICGSQKGNVFCWDLDVVLDSSKLIWPTYQQNYQRTGSINILHKIPSVAQLLIPSNNATNLPRKVTFNWNPVQGALKYWFQLSDSSSFSNLLIEDTSESEVTYSIDSLQNGKTYFWRIKAKNKIGTGGWSEIRKLAVIVSIPLKVALASPLNNINKQPTAILLSWNKSLLTENYKLQIAKDSYFTNLVLNDSTATDTSRLVTGLLNNTRYYWRVNAQNDGGRSDWSDVWNFTTIIPVPNPPFLSQPVNNSKNQNVNINLSWKLPQYTESFRINLAEDDQFQTSVVNDSLISDTLKNISGLKEGTRYFWKVSAKDIAGEGKFSDVWNFTTLLDSPDSLTATLMSGGKIKLNWTDKSGNVAGFKIERKFNGGYVLLDSVSVGVTQYIDTTILNTGVYYYRINSYTVSSLSGYSKEISVITAPNAPVLAGPGNNLKDMALSIKLSWLKCPYADTYRISLATDDQFTNLILNDSTLADTSRNIDGLKEGTKYYWKVNAKNLSGESPSSEVRSIITLLDAPDSLAVSIVDKAKTKLTWKDIPGSAAGFKIERKHNDGYTLIDSVNTGITTYMDSTITTFGVFQYRVYAYTLYAQSSNSNEASVLVSGVYDYNSKPTEFSIQQNYPNPFNPTTVIEYGLPSQSLVKIVVYNILGEVVKELANTVQSTGYHSIIFSGNSISSGVYFYVIDAKAINGSKQFRQIKKMMLLK